MYVGTLLCLNKLQASGKTIHWTCFWPELFNVNVNVTLCVSRGVLRRRVGILYKPFANT